VLPSVAGGRQDTYADWSSVAAPGACGGLGVPTGVGVTAFDGPLPTALVAYTVNV
jgi:hypothetical protein